MLCTVVINSCNCEIFVLSLHYLNCIQDFLFYNLIILLEFHFVYLTIVFLAEIPISWFRICSISWFYYLMKSIIARWSSWCLRSFSSVMESWPVVLIQQLMVSHLCTTDWLILQLLYSILFYSLNAIWSILRAGLTARKSKGISPLVECVINSVTKWPGLVSNSVSR